MNSGYLKLEKFFLEPEILEIESILRKFHNSWLTNNQQIYRDGAINSAYITSGDYLDSKERLKLLSFVGSRKIVNEAIKILGNELCFLNTQIFFNPFNVSQKNYWHRDIQYTNHTMTRQREIILNNQTQVLHLRVAIENENGIELIPNSHCRWDSSEELEVRLKTNGKEAFHDLELGHRIPLLRGDLLLFDANIIHRGLYGQNRFALDILFCKPLPEFCSFISQETLPRQEELQFIECPEVFIKISPL